MIFIMTVIFLLIDLPARRFMCFKSYTIRICHSYIKQ